MPVSVGKFVKKPGVKTEKNNFLTDKKWDLTIYLKRFSATKVKEP